MANLSDNYERAAWCVDKAADICGDTDPITVMETAHLIHQFLVQDPETLAALTFIPPPAVVTPIHPAPKVVS